MEILQLKKIEQMISPRLQAILIPVKKIFNKTIQAKTPQMKKLH